MRTVEPRLVRPDEEGEIFRTAMPPLLVLLLCTGAGHSGGTYFFGLHGLRDINVFGSAKRVIQRVLY